MAKKFEEQLAGVVAAINDCVAELKTPAVNFDNYLKKRIVLNQRILQIVFGATIGMKGAEYSIKFDGSLPTFNEIAKLNKEFSEFYYRAELPFINQNTAVAMDPNSNVLPMMEADIPKFNKIKIKDVKGAIVGGQSVSFPMISMLFSPSQLLDIAALAEDTRKELVKKKVLIIGGITLAVVAAATVAGVCIYNANHKNEEEDSNNKDEVPEVDLDGPSECDDIDDDVPVVELALTI